MTLAHLSFYSDTLRRDTHVTVIYPQVCERTPEDLREVIKPPYPVLYLLHGLSGNEESFIRFTSLERYARDMGLVIVMPTTDRLFYVNNTAGYPYGDYITQELPDFISSIFQVSTDRKDTFIAGASMGGYGALNAGLKYPNQYGFVGTLSGVIDIKARYRQGPDPLSPADFYLLFGDQDPAGTDKDNYYLLKRALETGIELPQIWMACGLDDGLVEQNRYFEESYGGQLDLVYIEDEGGHDWAFWDKYLEVMLNALPINI